MWINQDELEALATAIGTGDLDDFERLYVRKVGIRRSLRDFPNGDCVFFDADSRKCQVYQARPRQCRTWPFWSSNLKSAEAWEETCRVCPGSGKGKLYQLEQIEAQRKVIKV